MSLARKRKIAVLPPDINHSEMGFTIDNGGIRYGLKAIKGVGTSVLNFINIYRSRDKVPFKDFNDYYNRMHDSNNSIVTGILCEIKQKTGKNTNNPMKKDVEVALILSGAFDFCEQNRYKLLNHYIIDIKKEREASIMGEKRPMPLNENDYNRKTKLSLEKYYMGTYISEHPLDPFPYADFETAHENETIQTTGIVSTASMKTTKNNKKYLSIKFKAKDDIERTVNIFNENKSLELKNEIKKNSIIIINGKVSKRYNNINASSIKIAKGAKSNVLDTENISIEEKEKSGISKDAFMENNPVMFGDIFSTSSGDVFHMD